MSDNEEYFHTALLVVFLKEEYKCSCSICVWGNEKRMKRYPTHYVELSKTPQNDPAKYTMPVVHPTGAVYSGIAEVDKTLGGLYTGKITAFIGKSRLLSPLLHRVCVNTFDMFHSPTIVLDAGNQVNPFVLARVARLHMLSSQDVLQQVYLSRAYTVYQLTDLICYHVESLIKQVQPVTIVLTGLFSLLADAGVSQSETHQLLQIIMKQIKQITEEYQVAMILIDRYGIKDNAAVVDAWVDTQVQVQDMKHCPRIIVNSRNQEVTVTSETFGQLCLQDFGMVI